MKENGLPRQLENFHIYLWLLKDACWAAHLVIPGILMIIPTLSAAIWILWKSRQIRVEFVHNIAVLCWISANATWMCAEFLNLEPVLKPWILSVFYIEKIWRRY
jgi:hypothetical protein